MEDEADKKPVKGTTRRNPEETTIAALAIIDADEAARQRKTARLKALRLEQEQADAGQAATKKPRKQRASSATG